MYRVERGLAVVTLRNPPVNAVNHAMRVELLDAVTQANSDMTVHALILHGANGTFVAGADIKEFSQPARAPILSEVLSALEAGRVPVIAVLEGHALGGGLELALASRARFATANAKLGLPEVSLGLVPGAGGTQRLPRLIGPAAALDLMLSGRALEGATAHTMGLVDQLVDGVEGAIELVRRALADGRGWLRTCDRVEHLAEFKPELFDETRAARAPEWEGQLAPFKLLEAVERAGEVPFAEGLRFEREAFLQCRNSAQHRALSYLFFAQREAAKLTPAPTQKFELRDVAVVDSGPAATKLARWLESVGLRVSTSNLALQVASTPHPEFIALEVRDQLIEIVAPGAPSWSAIAALISVGKKQGLVPVVTQNTSQFMNQRFFSAMPDAAEGKALVCEGVFARESDIDVLLVAGCRYPRFLGGPMFRATQEKP